LQPGDEVVRRYKQAARRLAFEARDGTRYFAGITNRCGNRHDRKGRSGSPEGLQIIRSAAGCGAGIEECGDTGNGRCCKLKWRRPSIPYIRPKRSVRPKRSAIRTDQHGFAADRELAHKLRNKVARTLQLSRRRNVSPVDKKLFVRLSQEIRLMAAALLPVSI
jgi:hypothetical protein